MLFGQLETKDLAKADLHLPKDRPETKKVLSAAKKKKTAIHVGCAKWGRPDWVGKIYPKGTRAANFLDEYAKQFDCIEFNAIFYKLPEKKEVHTWKNKVGQNFKFFPKFTEVITHRKRLKNVQAEVDAFLDVVHEFGENLGPLFLMPHPQMGPKHMDTILGFIDALPKDVEVFTELRHPDWYTEPHFSRICSELEKRHRGMVITDAAGRRDCVHMRLTTPEAFIRFVGNSLHPTDYTRIDEWVDRIHQWMKEGLETCYLFMHQHEELYSPELSRYLIEQLNKKCGTGIHVPEFVQEIKAPNGGASVKAGKEKSVPQKKVATAAVKKSPVKKKAVAKSAALSKKPAAKTVKKKVSKKPVAKKAATVKKKVSKPAASKKKPAVKKPLKKTAAAKTNKKVALTTRAKKSATKKSAKKK